MKAKRGESSAKRLFLPWTVCPDRPPNFRELMVEQGMDYDDVIMHFPATEEEALASASGSFFGKSLERHNDFKRGEEGVLVRSESGEIKWIPERHGMLEIWEHPDTAYKDRYAIGSDVSAGLGLDYSVAYVKDRLTDALVARMRSNRVDANAWGFHLRDLSEYYGGATVCCERNGIGQTTIKCLQDLYVPQYVRILSGKTAGIVQKTFGWNESPNAKWELCGDLKTWFFKTESRLPCAILSDEAATFIVDGSRLTGESGKNDDCVIAAALAIQADSFMREVIEIPHPKPEPPSNTLEYIAFKDKEAAMKEAMGGGEYDTEW
jgi:hypothetical protein